MTLPPSIESQILEILTEPQHEWPGLIDELCAEHPGHEQDIRDYMTGSGASVDASTVRTDLAHDALHEGGLACAVGSHKPGDPGLDRDGQVA